MSDEVCEDCGKSPCVMSQAFNKSRRTDNLESQLDALAAKFEGSHKAHDHTVANYRSSLDRINDLSVKLRECEAERDVFKQSTAQWANAAAEAQDRHDSILAKAQKLVEALRGIADRNAHGVMVTIAREALKEWGK